MVWQLTFSSRISKIKLSKTNSSTLGHEERGAGSAVTAEPEANVEHAYSPQHNQIESLVERCMMAAHLNQRFLIENAKSNAKYFYDEFGKVIPLKFLSDYKSHCWEKSYSSWWTKSSYSGYIGNISFCKHIDRRKAHVLSSLTKRFPKKKYKTNFLCLPRVFLAGFPKCGSSFLYCVVKKLISMSTGNVRSMTEVEKEPHFWVKANAASNIFVPKVEDISSYLLTFLPGMHAISHFNKTNVTLMDGTPNLLFNWPRFRRNEHNLTNYCLLPSTLPNLLPSSKYLVIMRNPVQMLYSAFWFSCTMYGIELPRKLKLKGPDLFHERVTTKIHLFNKCMRNESDPSISEACMLDTGYDSCIQQRMHLLDKCIHQITFNIFSPELPRCGRSRVAMGVYFVYIHKWLSVVSRSSFFFLTLEELIKSPRLVFQNVLKFLDLKTSISSKNMVEQIKNLCNENTNVVHYKEDPKLHMREDTRSLLETFYRPFNHLLARLLDNDKFLWT